MRYFVPGGAAAALIFYVFVFVLFPVGPASAQEPAEESEWSTNLLTSTGGTGILILLLILAMVLVAAIGWRAGGRTGAWPHWAGLARGLGDAAFLLAVLGTFQGIAHAMHEVSRLGAAVTPADMGDGIATSCARLVLGSVAALIGLGCAGFVRLGQKKNSS